MNNQEQNELKQQIEKALDTIRPYLAQDGGDVEFVDVDDEMVVNVRLLGACNNCPMSLQTLKLGVEQTIKRFVPVIKSVNEVQ
jgi:Fe-S cluster biogenesis protein NfuA